MNKLKKIAVFLILILQIKQAAFCATEANQILNLGLGEVLEIEKIIVEDIEHERNAPLPNVRITNTNKVNNQNTILTMTPVSVKIHTNVSSPIVVSAQFTKLKHVENPYEFADINLSVSPTSYTISNPYDHVESGVFIPYAVIKPDTVIGDYVGTLLFTLGVIWKKHLRLFFV